MRTRLVGQFHRLLIALLFVAAGGLWSRAAEPVADAGLTNAPIHRSAFGLNEEYLTFGLDRWEPLRTTRFFGEPLWKYFASLIYILLAFYISKFVDYVTTVWLRRLAAKTQTKVDDLLIELAHGPIKVVSFVIFLYVGLGVFQWPPGAQLILTKGFVVIVACSITYMVLKLVDLSLNFWRQRTAREADKLLDAQLFPVLRKGLKAFVVVVAVLVTSDSLGIKVTGLIASLSIGGLAIGLAAQDTLANLFGAVAVFMDKPFRVGDRIKLEAVEGTVETIGLRSTRVRSLDGHLITIPNKTMGNATITNVSLRPNIKTEMNLGLTYDTPTEKIEQALKILEEVYRGHPMTADLILSFNRFADSAINLFVIHWANTTDQREYFAVMQELNLAVKRRFDAAGISFAFPSQTVYLRQDSDWRVIEGAPPRAT